MYGEQALGHSGLGETCKVCQLAKAERMTKSAEQSVQCFNAIVVVVMCVTLSWVTLGQFQIQTNTGKWFLFGLWSFVFQLSVALHGPPGNN